MYYCIYTSSAAFPLSDQELMNIKMQSKSEWDKLGITGILVFHRNKFVHYYEGQKNNVDVLIKNLKVDERHADLAVSEEGKIKKRQFATAVFELRVLDKDPLFGADELVNDSEGIKKRINEKFLNIT